MELYQLKSFVAIARERNLTRAAEKLHLSQSALSSQLRQLEGELGLPLFQRTARGMELTDAGRELFTLAEEMLEAAQKLRLRAMALHQGVGEAVTIGLNADPGFLRVAPLNRRLSLLHGELSVTFRPSQTGRTAPLLRQGEVDLAFFYGDGADADLQHLLLARVRVCVVIPARLRAAGPPPGWPEVAELPWVWAGNDSPFYAALLENLERRRLLPNLAVTATDEQIVRELVRDGQGAALMREDEARQLAEGGEVQIWEQGWLTLPLSLAWLAKNGEKNQVRAVREAIRHTWQPPAGETQEKYWL